MFSLISRYAAVAAFLLTTSQVLASSPDSILIGGLLSKRGQIVFPPTNGPCRQNAGLAPLQCTDTACVDIPDQGVCNIQTQDGFPICGCCEAEMPACSACGGDAGGGICQGTGSTTVGYQGCPCSNTGGNYPQPGKNESMVCPEDNGQPTQSCDAVSCGGSTVDIGICDAKTYISGGPWYRHCSCCPARDEFGCDSCGGDAGGGTCNGIDQYQGIQYLGCKCTPGNGGNVPLPPIIPFPIPPPGFPIPPPGTPNPKQPCSNSVTAQCSNCNGLDGWCQEGEDAGCPCQEDCATGEDQLQCSEETCDGEADEKCTIGPQSGCECTPPTQCPTGVQVPTCSDTNCCGATNSSIISSCVGGSNNENKDCPCFQYYEDSPPYQPLEISQIAAQQAFLDALGPTDEAPSPTPTPTGKLTCSANSANYVPSSMVEVGGNVTPNQLLYTLRQVICTNACEEPANLPDYVSWATGTKTTGDCEVSVAIQGGIEAWFYRGTPSTGDQWQQCWDSTQEIIETCVKEGPNTGWVNGPNEYQFYQGGFRALNGDGSIHEPITGKGLEPVVAVGSVAPKNARGITCGSGTGGARLADCLNILGSIVNGEILSDTDTTESFCTTDSTCLQSGNTGSADGMTVYSSYCEVAASGSCAFVAASKISTDGGFPGKSCFSPADMSNFIRLAANQCAGDNKWATGFKPGDLSQGYPYTVYGIVDSTNPGVVYAP